ncbi:alpha/beta fold hydrolase [Saccharothrix mutabilis subsp. mutabilis]|uniref:Alpha/beta fold hydrolase n=1 Tax=Saccharothrix mutabilis subsp. mutabilis TaxID=66855 RepID=A0ABP3E7J9_9PSEU
MPSARRQKSTTVRASSIRAAFTLLERLAPPLGGRLALRIWCTPRHARPSSPAPSGTRHELSVAGSTVVAETWGTGPIVYLVHGWGGHRNQLARFVEPLVEAGYQVVSYDALSHGESGPGTLGPKRATLPEFSKALTAVAAHFGPAHAIVAHSMGASATALAVLDGLPTTRLAFIAPVADPLSQTHLFADHLGFGPRTHAAFLARLERVAGNPIEFFNIPPRATDQDLPPLLVLHDTRDTQVPHPNGEAITGAWPNATLITTTGLGHHRILSTPEVLTEVISFVTEPAPVQC